MKKSKNIYLDYAATTPVDPAVKKAMEQFWLKDFGNPSAVYRLGLTAKAAVEDARTSIAKLIGARAKEIIFTAGGTESINLAIFGVAKNFKQGRGHIITTKIEHHAVLNSCQELERQGHQVTYLNVDREGFVSLKELEQAILPETFLASVMFANNEIGTIEPIAQIGKMLKRINAERARQGLQKIIFHTDACQAAGACDLNVQSLGVDLLTANGSKVYGPKQSGFLYVRTGTKLEPLIYGGGQEQGMRSGTENVPAIVGLAKALELAAKHRVTENRRLIELRNYFANKIFKLVDRIELNGPKDIENKGHNQNNALNRLPNNINLTFKDAEGEALMLYLDAAGVYVSQASACSAITNDIPHVLLATGKSQKDALSSLRITIGKYTKKSDLDYVLKILPPLVAKIRKVKTL